ncbi:hypothetical protein A1O3_07992 [Capronia epimyces CBS 606.96]|uniref:Uncharacterized protein n=1 Tax=Capronia epimyces CBS 606.96 TaxID=1182542 RepID=W9YBG4_9EURO|nr:uncharacterized protein A1O3_07992 [Capronia epimyces CBS 606.96]EXJ79709.1 hypothetical protein A1O3_07992 [Capronia epimyces CBS 606.96]
MDGGDRRRSQYGQPYQTPAQSRPLPGQPIGASASDRFPLPSTPARSEMGRSPITRPYLPGYPGYGYGQQPYGSSQMQGSSPMQGIEMQYSPATYLQDPSRQQQVQASPSHQQQQPYGPYAPGAMLPPAAPPSLYDNIPFQQRQTAIEVMASQFAVPQYMPPGEQTGVAVGSGPSHYLASQAEQSSYTPVAVARGPMGQSYASTSTSLNLSGLLPRPERAEAGGQVVGQTALEEGLWEYRRRLRATFDDIVAGRVTEACEKLLTVSRWLVGSVPALGLHHDDEYSHPDRLALWREFNLAWEALGQKQKDMTEEALRTATPPTDLLSADAITSLLDDLVDLCDQLEQYALVDYEMGIWEEQITHIFMVCLDLLSRNETLTHTSGAQAEQAEE